MCKTRLRAFADLQNILQQMAEDRGFSGLMHHVRGWLVVIGALLAAVLVWFYFRDVPPLGDAGAFAGMATHMADGKVLYKDIFDNKAPGIFFLIQFFNQLTGNSPWSLHIMHLLHLMAACCCIVWLWNRSGLKAWWMALLLLPWLLLRFTHWPYYFASGYTEEYALYYLIFSVWLITESDLNRQRWVYLIPAGITLGFCMLLRETMLFSAGAVFIWAFLSSERRWATLLQLWAGIAVPFVLFGLYLHQHSAWSHYTEYLQFATGYSGDSGWIQRFTSRITTFHKEWISADSRVIWLALASLLVCTDREFMVQTRFLPILFPLLTISLAVPLGMGPQAFGHYYLPLLFGCLLCCITFIIWSFEKLYWLSHVLSIHRFTNVFIPAAGLWLTFPDQKAAFNHFLYARFPAGSEEAERLAVRKKCRDFNTIYTDVQDAGRIYHYTQKTSASYHPSPYYVYYQAETAGDFASVMCERLRKSFFIQKPDCFITSQNPGYGTSYCGMKDSIDAGYTLIDSMINAENGRYYFRLRNDLLENWLEKRRKR